MISIGRKQKKLGTYDTAKEAAVVYDRAVLKANQCTTLLNFPDMVHNLDVEPKRNKYFGVTDLGTGRFTATIRINGQDKSLGTFKTAKRAAFVYDQAAAKNKIVIVSRFGLRPGDPRKVIVVVDRFGYRPGDPRNK